MWTLSESSVRLGSEGHTDPEGGWRTGEGVLISITLLCLLRSSTFWGHGCLRAGVRQSHRKIKEYYKVQALSHRTLGMRPET